MKFIPIENITKARVVIRTILGEDGLPLTFAPGEVKDVLESVARHPALQRYIGRALKAPPMTPKVVAPSPKAVIPPPVVAPPPKVVVPPPVVEPIVEEPVVEEETSKEDDSNEDNRDLYLEAPGITEKNVDAILEVYPSLADLAVAEDDALLDCGVSKSFITRVLEWASATFSKNDSRVFYLK
jgi:hypothetical protein